MSNEYYFWESRVRDYELDFQGIVNNASYFNYLDHARALYFEEIGVNVVLYSENEINIVLINTQINFKNPLKYGDIFCVKSCLTRKSKLRFIFDQTINMVGKESVVLESKSEVCCVNAKTGKFCIINELEQYKIILS